ncbi:MAG: hypothetical protein MUE68_07935 [Bacteroidetes bacterium]|jgi:hypothetical protein|nr:hypothetical protein [Bacteroidota bacterium]
MGAILDIIGSYIFKAAMIGIILATSYSLNEVMTKKAQQTNLEKSMNVSMSVLEWDLRNLGYNYFTGPTITMATGNDLQYRADVQNDGTAESLRWYVTTSYVTIGDSTVARYNVRRYVDGVYYNVFRRLRHWDMKYVLSNGTVTSSPSPLSAIVGFRVKLTSELSFPVGNEYLTATREITLYPANLSL